MASRSSFWIMAPIRRSGISMGARRSTLPSIMRLVQPRPAVAAVKADAVQAVKVRAERKPDRAQPQVTERKPDRAQPQVTERKPDRAQPQVTERKPGRAEAQVAERKPDRAQPQVAERKPDRAQPQLMDAAVALLVVEGAAVVLPVVAPAAGTQAVRWPQVLKCRA